MESRDYLSSNSLLYLRNDSGTAINKFQIDRILGAGGSSVCYKARLLRKNGSFVPGTLKEFYPEDSDRNRGYWLERPHSGDEKERNQLLSKGSVPGSFFVEARNTFRETYIRLDSTRSRYKDLFAPIATFYLYKGIGDEDRITYYVWIPYDVEIDTFGDYLKTVCKDMNKGFAKTMHLKMILESIRNLASAIKAVHTAGLRHLDVTPQNFGLQKMNSRVTSAVSLIDVNTMFSNSDDIIFRSLGTDGFNSPLLNNTVTNIPVGFDIFSIGACLYYALVMKTGENDGYENSFFVSDSEFRDYLTEASPTGTKIATENGLPDTVDKSSDKYLEYFRHKFDSIDESICRSPIFRDSDRTEDRILQNQIAAVLKKCLTIKKSDMYQGVSLLIDDLNKAIGYLGLIDGMETVSRNNRQIVVMNFPDKEEYMSKETKLGANGAIWNFLYDKPLYGYAKNKKLNILVMGLGIYASKFTDIAFQLSQTDSFFTEITVVSNDIEADKKRFLSARPEYPNFFEIDGEKAIKVPDSPYGIIKFIHASFGDKMADNENQLRRISEKTGLEYRFCFSAMHSDKLNFDTAEAAKNVFGKGRFMAGYAVFGDKNTDIAVSEDELPNSLKGKLFPVDINITVDKNPDYKLLNQMAFNAHLVWTGSLDDIELSKAEFRRSYNWESSFANAVSIKYKLKSLGITFDPAAPHKAAASYISETDGNSHLFDKLVMYEHSRWNIETMAKGYICLHEDNYDELENATKDDKGKRHPCLVPSFISDIPEASLSHESWNADNRSKWNNFKDEDIALLDPLDRVSVKLHESFRKKKAEYDRTPLLNMINEIDGYLAAEPSLHKVFSSYVLSVNALFESRKTVGTYENTRALINSYKYYHRIFTRRLKALEKSAEKDKIERLIKEAHKAVFPSLQAQAYTNYKKKDEALIRYMPFILTYTQDMRFLIPLVTEHVNEYSTTELFNNVAAVLMTSPKHVTYAVERKTLQNNMNGVVSALKYVRNTLNNHLIPTKISVLVLTEENLKNDARVFLNSLSEEFAELYSGEILTYNCSEEHMSLENYLKACSRSNNPYTAFQNNDSKISGYLSGCRKNSREVFPSFTFDSASQSFECVGSCEYLRYIPFKASIKTEDIFLAKGKASEYEEPELLMVYKDLWNLYKSNPGNTETEAADAKRWKSFCKYMKQFSDQKQEVLVCDTGSTEDYSRVIPSFYKGTFEKLLAFFKKEKMAGDYSFSYISSSMIKLRAQVTVTVKNYFEKLLTEHMEELCSAENFEPDKRGSKIYIPCGSLFFRDVELPKDTSERNSYVQFLRRLSSLGLISGYKTPQPNSQKVSFMCTSRDVKKLITVEGYLFEIYCYYSLIETGFFDEVRTSLKVMWNELNLASEFDIVAVKNFRTVLIECKTTDEIEQEFYNKLFALKNIFGINSMAFLVADMCSRHEESVSFQSTRGDAYGIKTISATKEIYCKKNSTDEFPGLGLTIAEFLK